MNHAAVFELLPLYSLDALEDADIRAVERHLAWCDECRAELSSYSAVAFALSGEIEPDPNTWKRILERIETR